MSFLRTKLQPFFTSRFLKFCGVGASGVAVNLGVLFLLAEVFRLNANLSSAVAIEISIVSNFIINEFWTFSDRSQAASTSWQARAVRFHVVSILGGVMQWMVFVAFNAAWFHFLADARQVEAYFGGPGEWFERVAVRLVFDPPDVGGWKYLSQLVGIGVATFWNFLVNFYWTWKEEQMGDTHE